VSLDERYGRRARPARRRLLWAGLGAFVVAALAWVVWAAVGIGRSSVTWHDIAVDVSDPALVRLTFQVSAAPGAPAVCAVRATAAGGAIVGWADVAVQVTPAGRAVVRTQLRTSEAATGGSVSSCVRR
jgi:hypothetical protein